MADNVLQITLKANTAEAIAGIRGASTAMQGLVDKTTGIKTSMASARASATAFNGVLAEEKAAFDRLRASVDPIFAATQRYENAVREVTTAQRLGIVTAEEAAAVQGRLRVQYDAGAGGLAHVGGQARNTGFMVQNAAYQFGDFAVQVAGGTSAVRAASQQLPQLLSGFGVWGAVIGAASAVLIPLIGYLLGSKEAMEAGKKATTAYGEAFSALKSQMAGAADLQNEYTAAVKSGNAEVIAAVGREANIRQKLLVLEMLDLRQKADAAQKAQAAEAASVDAAQAAVDARIAQIAQLKQALADANANDTVGIGGADPASIKADIDAATLALTDQTAELEKQQGVYNRNTAEYELLGAQVDSNNAKLAATTDLLHSIEGAAAAGGDQIKVAADFAELLMNKAKGASDAVFGISEGQPGNGFLSVAISQAQTLMDKLWGAVQAKSALEKYNSMVTAMDRGGRGRGQPTSSEPVFHRADGTVFDPHPKKVSDGSGGGSAPKVDTFASLSTEAKDAMAAMDQAIAAINEKVKAGLTSTADAAKGVSSAHKAAADKIADLIVKLEAIGGPNALASVAALRAQLVGLRETVGGIGEELASGFTDGFENAFEGFVARTKTASDAFKSFGQSVLNTMAKMATESFTQRVMSPLFSSLLGGLFPSANGNAFAGGSVVPFAKGGLPGLSAFSGGIVAKPTLFAMGGTKTGLMGEAGPEAILPLSRGADGRLGVQSSGGGGGNITVNVHNLPAELKVAETRRSMGPAGLQLDVIFDAVDKHLAGNLQAGRGPTAGVLRRSGFKPELF